MSGPGLYVHIPFCRKKCPYCSFVSFEDRTHLARYMEAVMAEASMVAESGVWKDVCFGTLYIGGGTPSLVPASVISDLLDHLFSLFAFDRRNGLETTVECNPESLTAEWIMRLKEKGVTRLSIGVQDLTERGLETLGRIHGVADAIHAVKLARESGIRDVSLDLMYCLPGQDLKWLEETLSRAVELGPSHVSAYELTIEPGTAFAENVEDLAQSLPDQEQSLELTRFLEHFLESHGYMQYEISNFSLPGRQCRHNVNYWRGGHYLGLGCAAVSYLDGTRCFNTGDLAAYMECIENGLPATANEERLDKEARFRETVVMWMRMNSGADTRELFERFAIDPFQYYDEVLEELRRKGLVETDGNSGRLRLTTKGRYLSNYVLSHLV